MTLPIDTTLMPADVRSGGVQAQKLYSTALSFENLLTKQLTQSIADAMKGGDDDSASDGSDDGSAGVTSGGTSSATSQLQAQLPTLLADAVQQGGGLGLAPQLYRALKLQSGSTK